MTGGWRRAKRRGPGVGGSLVCAAALLLGAWVGVRPCVAQGSGSAAAAGSGAGQTKQGGAATTGAAGSMEFSDEPNFAVAGVTDWTAVGGHGSDAVLRTSEDLTRETVRLGDGDAGKGAEVKQSGADAATEARLRAAVARQPESAAANRELGAYELRVGKFAQAVAPLEKVVALDGGRADDEYALARACEGAGDVARAEEHVRAALAKGDEARFHALLGEVEERRGDPVAAVKELERATQMEASEGNYLAWGSELLLHRAIWEAEAVFARGARAFPESARLKMAWGSALFAGARYDGAAEQMCAASDLEPLSVEPYVSLGKMALVSVAPLPCVVGRLERFVRLQPTSADANYLLGMLLVKQGSAAEVERGRGLLQRAVALDPKYAAGYLELGVLAAGQKQTAEAKEDFEKAVAADPGLSEAHYRLGVLYDRAGDKARAEAEFARHEELDREQEAAVERQRKAVKQFEVVERAGRQ